MKRPTVNQLRNEALTALAVIAAIVLIEAALFQLGWI
jgi:hypothetical protein